MDCKLCYLEQNDPNGARLSSMAHTWQKGCREYEEYEAFVAERCKEKGIL